MNLNERILLNELRFNDTDDQIIEYIREDVNRFINQSIQKSAKELYTVPNTIVRFSKKLGYKGFSELKFALKQEAQELQLGSKIQEKSYDNMPKNIIKTLEVIDFSLIKKVIKKMKEAKKVVLVGIGDSTYFCEMLLKNLRCVGKTAEFFEHRHDVMYNITKCEPKDLYLFISVSGESETIIQAAQKAKERGAYIISLTHFCENTLSKLADVNLFYWAPYEVINNYNATDRVGIMILIRTISEMFWEQYK